MNWLKVAGVSARHHAAEQILSDLSQSPQSISQIIQVAAVYCCLLNSHSGYKAGMYDAIAI